ncbi:MAG: hypothetical protein FJW64_02775 [Actinobacteria bacterium]|nr:hypothetical protein [Actinomycetota bacterium]
MANGDETQQTPFARPGFIVGAVLVAALIVAGVFLTILNLNRGSDTAPPVPGSSSSATSSAAPSPTATEGAGGISVCGLAGEVLSGTVTTAPDSTWEYQDVFAYPTSPTYGPGATAPQGYRYCYQHSPEGAVFAAANTTIGLFGDVEARRSLLEYALTNGTYRDALLSEVGTSSSDVRASIAGFRVLSYDGSSARVDVAFRGTAQGQAVNGSAVLDLTWWQGDWKINADNAEPFRLAQLPDTSGYITWRQE